jgi:hypothetical protein
MSKSQTITQRQIILYFKVNNFKIRHSIKAIQYAINTLNEEVGTDVVSLMELILENRPIDSLHTHSYGFHTANGRHIIDTFKALYYEFEEELV